ncbi:MAG TPA: type II secretion system F family protein [Actinomycetota bacterium]|nr:type II secretion system F family protein [Actinomycetota bacterium]
MSALAITLLGLAAWLAERGSRSVRRGHLGLGDLRPPARRSGVAAPPGWAIWASIGAAIGFIASGLASTIGGAAAGLVLWRLRQRRRARAAAAELDEQLVDAVASITAAIRAGRSVPQALSFAASEARPPLRDSLRALDRSIELGVPLDEAVAAWTRKVDTDDARLLAGVLTLHRRSGGDLPTVLDEVTATLRERRAAVGEVRALTAQARLSGMILGVLPFGFFAFLWLTSRTEIEGAFRSATGLAAISLGFVLEGLAFLWIRHLLEVR